MRLHPLASLLKHFCCRIIGSLSVLHFRIRDVSSETDRSKSFVGRCATARLQLSEIFPECTKVFRSKPRRLREMWRWCVRCQFRDASGTLGANAVLQPWHAEPSACLRNRAMSRIPIRHCSQRSGWYRRRITRYRCADVAGQELQVEFGRARRLRLASVCTRPSHFFAVRNRSATH